MSLSDFDRIESYSHRHISPPHSFRLLILIINRWKIDNSKHGKKACTFPLLLLSFRNQFCGEGEKTTEWKETHGMGSADTEAWAWMCILPFHCSVTSRMLLRLLVPQLCILEKEVSPVLQGVRVKAQSICEMPGTDWWAWEMYSQWRCCGGKPLHLGKGYANLV